MAEKPALSLGAAGRYIRRRLVAALLFISSATTTSDLAMQGSKSSPGLLGMLGK
jgi:hypothetical protein